jgi:branched-chain amino acid transport system permease protein
MNRSLRGPAAAAVIVAAAGLAGISPAFSAYDRDLLVSLLIYVILAQSWNLLAGFGGQVSLGLSAFVGTGAYAGALAMIHAHAGWITAVAFSGLVGGAIAVLLSPALLRLRGDYFAIGTLAVALALQAIALNWTFTGRSTGLILPVGSVPAPQALLDGAIVLCAIALLAVVAVQRSRFGLRLAAIRDDEDAAVGLGVSSLAHRATIFAISSMLAAAAGCLVALQQISFEPVGAFDVNWTLSALLMTVIGGTATLLGPIFGAIVVYYGLAQQLASFPTASLVIEGALLIAVIRFAPRGLWPLAAGYARQAYARIRSGVPTGMPG